MNKYVMMLTSNKDLELTCQATELFKISIPSQLMDEMKTSLISGANFPDL